MLHKYLKLRLSINFKNQTPDILVPERRNESKYIKPPPPGVISTQEGEREDERRREGVNQPLPDERVEGDGDEMRVSLKEKTER